MITPTDHHLQLPVFSSSVFSSIISSVTSSLLLSLSPVSAWLRNPHLTSRQRSETEMALTSSASLAWTSEAEVSSFDDLVTRHPEVDGTVIQTGIVRAPQPRVARVVGGLRNAFTMGRSSARPKASFEILNPSTENLRGVKAASKLPWKSTSMSTLRPRAHQLASATSIDATPAFPPATTPPPAAPLVVSTAPRGRSVDEIVQTVQRGIASLADQLHREQNRQLRAAILDVSSFFLLSDQSDRS